MIKKLAIIFLISCSAQANTNVDEADEFLRYSESLKCQDCDEETLRRLEDEKEWLLQPKGFDS
jgi:hypothetical protein